LDDPALRPSHPAPTRAYLAWGVICLVWGTTFLVNKVAIDAIPPLRLTGIRFLVAGLVLQGVVLARRRRSGAPAVPLRAGLVGIVTLGIGTGVTVWAQQWLPSGLTSVLTAATPFWMVLLDAAMPGGTRPSRHALGGLLLGLCGILLIASQQPLGSLRADYLWAVGTVLLAGVAWSSGSILTRHQKGGHDALAVASAQMGWAGAALLVGSLAAGERMPGPLSLVALAEVAYLTVFGSCIAFVCYLYALRHLPVAFVSTFTYVNPVLALWLGWLILDERLTAGIVAATVLIFAGLLLTRRAAPAAAAPHRSHHPPPRHTLLHEEAPPKPALYPRGAAPRPIRPEE
jgi:drug/metabolite transporter (DMT)-like permease